MKTAQFVERSPGLIKHGSIDFLIPDVKMLDEFYRRRAISIEDIHGDHEVFADTESRVQYFPALTFAKHVVIKQGAGSDVRSQHLSIKSLEQVPTVVNSKGAKCDYKVDQCWEPLFSSTVNAEVLDLPLSSSKPLPKMDAYDQDQTEALLDNRSSSFAVDFHEFYADFEASVALETVGPGALGPGKQSDLCARLTDVTSRSSFFADNELNSSRWPTDFDDRDSYINTGSVIVLGSQHISREGVVFMLSDEHEEAQNVSYPLEDPLLVMEEKPNTALRHTRSIKGFPGRFSMLHAKELSSTGKEATEHSFGLMYHPNGRIINKAFMKDPRYQVTSLDEGDIMHDTMLSAAIRHGEITAAKLEPLKQMRSSEERALRREIHRECALARLEGVSVGYFRYFAGHMTVEEYLAARICVCWSDCFCNKLCTRFGDMLCPCSESLELCD